MIVKFNYVFVNCCTIVIVLSTEGYQIIYCCSWLNRLVSCLFIMSRMYNKKPAGNKIRQMTDMISAVNIVTGKASIVSVDRAGGCMGHSELLSEDSRGWSLLRKFLGCIEHLDWLKINLNVAKIVTVQDYKCTKS